MSSRVHPWAECPASHDFRSDTVTTPTPSMHEAITNVSLGDDVYGESENTNGLCRRLAEMTGTERGAVLPTATMCNISSLMSHLSSPPHAILADHRAHVLNYEAGNIAALAGAFPVGVVPKNGRYLTLEDIKMKYQPRDCDQHYPPTTVLSLENPLDGEIMPLKEFTRITNWAREMGMKIHLDGARLWHIPVANQGQLKEFCSQVDTTSLCFSKGLGAPGGSIVVGKEESVKKVEKVRKMLGGAGRQVGIAAKMMEVGLEEQFLGGGLKKTHEQAQRIAGFWEKRGGKLEKNTETNMVWLDLQSTGISEEEWQQACARRGLKVSWIRIVVHFQNSEDAIERLCKAMEEVLQSAKSKNDGAQAASENKGQRYNTQASYSK